MALIRNADRILKNWLEGPDRKPLVLRGARHTGKSTAVGQLANHAHLFLELNLERHADLALVRTCRSAQELLERLQQHHGLSTLPAGTLLFLDEVQEHPEALRWLRFFREDHAEIAVVAAGSLLEVRLRDAALPFPVGRVEFLRMEPLTFLESLDACGDQRIASDLRSHYDDPDGVPEGLHHLAMERFRNFLLVGGMPEAISVWLRSGSLVEVAHVHAALNQAYQEDLLKYGLSSGTSTLQSVLAAAPAFYGSRFKNRDLVPGQKDRAIHQAIDLLDRAMVLHRAKPTARKERPLLARTRAAHKLLPLDIGLALSQLGVLPEHMIEQKVEALLDGRVAESVVGIQLLAGQPHRTRELFFWARESSSGSAAEVDFLLPTSKGVLPIEVKAGSAGSLKSMHQFLAASKGTQAIRLSSNAGCMEQHKVNLPQGGQIDYTLRNLPLYLAELLCEGD